MNKFKHAQLIVILINTKSEIESGIPSVNNFVISKFKEICHLSVSRHDLAMRFNLYPTSLFLVVCDIPPAQSSLSLSVLE